MNIGLHECPEVLQIAAATGLDPFGVVGRLHRVWGWFDQNTTDGNARSVTFVTLDSFTCSAGFAAAMVEAGWLGTTADGLSLPHFDRHNGESAKKRAQTARRVAKSKNRVKQPLGAGNAPCVTSVTPHALPEKRREEKRENSRFPSDENENRRDRGGEKAPAQAQANAVKEADCHEVLADPLEALVNACGVKACRLVAHIATLGGGSEAFDPASLLAAYANTVAQRGMRTYRNAPVTPLTIRPDLESFVWNVAVKFPEQHQLVRRQAGADRAEPDFDWRLAAKFVTSYHRRIDEEDYDSWSAVPERTREQILAKGKAALRAEGLIP